VKNFCGWLVDQRYLMAESTFRREGERRGQEPHQTGEGVASASEPITSRALAFALDVCLDGLNFLSLQFSVSF
jgi:hypothetical protein